MRYKKHRSGTLSAIPWVLFSLLGLYACGGGGGGSGGSPPPPAPPPPPPPPTIQTIDVLLSSTDVVGGSATAGSATADVQYNETDSELQVTVSISNLTADAVFLRNGFAGAVGGELYALTPGTNPDEWTLTTTALTQSDVDVLEAGAMYIAVTAAANPGVSLRGQIAPAGVEVIRFELSAEQVTTNSNSSASAVTWITVDANAQSYTVNLVTSGVADATSAELHEAMAGEVGPVLFSLSQDPTDTSLWHIASTDMFTELVDAANSGEVYVAVSTIAAPDGEIRGQLIPDDIELVITELTDAAVIMNGVLSKSRTELGRAMTTIRPEDVTSNVNLFQVADADRIEMRRAPEGQNGPVFASYTQDINDPTLWTLRDVAIDGALAAALDNRTLYIQVSTPADPDGVARGQLETADSQLPPDTSAFVVTSIDPPNAAEVTALPASIVATLSREPLDESVGQSAVRVEASGGDGSFGDGNEVTVVPSAVTSNGATVQISLAGIAAANDVYRVSLIGGGSDGIVDESAIPLDGNGDGQPGGVYESAFELLGPGPASLSTIQEMIFTPTCATSNCHSGTNPPDGLDLSAGSAYANTVNVASVQMPSLFRIRPGDPDASYLVRKIEGVGIVANRMPLGQPPLSAEEIDLIRRWVSEGAQDN